MNTLAFVAFASVFFSATITLANPVDFESSQLVRALPSEAAQRASMMDAMKKAMQIEECVTKNKDAPDSNAQVSHCVLNVFSTQIESGKALFTEFLKGKGFDLDGFFVNASPEVKGFIETARTKIHGHVSPVLKDVAGAVITKVTGWVKTLLG